MHQIDVTKSCQLANDQKNSQWEWPNMVTQQMTWKQETEEDKSGHLTNLESEDNGD